MSIQKFDEEENKEITIVERILNDGTKMELVIIDGKSHVTLETAGVVLGYNSPTVESWKRYNAHKEVLEPYTTLTKLVSLAFFSNTEKAIERQKEVLQIMDKIDKKGYYFSDEMKPIDIMKAKARLLVEAVDRLEKSEFRLDFLEKEEIPRLETEFKEERKDLENRVRKELTYQRGVIDKLERETETLNDEEQGIIRIKVNEMVIELEKTYTGKTRSELFGTIYSLVNGWFPVGSYKKSKGQSSMRRYGF